MSEVKCIKKHVEQTTTTIWELTTDDIEALIRTHMRKAYGDADIDFNWHVGQWVSLSVTAKHTHVIQED